MRDLVENVIDGILQQEKMQQHAQRQQKQRAAIKSRQAQTKAINHALLRATGRQMPTDNKDRDPALWKVSTQFEAIFVQQMMSEMRKTVHKSDFIPTGFAEDVHASMMDEAIAQASVKHHSFGLADSIYRQLERPQYDSKQAAAIQEISASADKLKMQINHSISLEAIKHAH